MRRKLLLLNVALLALIGFAGWQLRTEWQSARARKQALLEGSVPAPAALQQPVPDQPQAKPASEYLPIATQLLFSPDRNPDVVVEVVKPKPMPPFPRYFGTMDFGEGPTVILGMAEENSQKGYHLGEKVGEFTLVSVDRKQIVFDWEGKKVEADLSELQPKPEAKAPPSAKRGAAAAKAAPRSVAPPKRVVSIAPAGPAPGNEGAEARSCAPGDTSPAGTVAEGYRKVITRTPFSSVCRWVKVK